jgi:FlaA1/EpsC-like NDP-sugar epimerase
VQLNIAFRVATNMKTNFPATVLGLPRNSKRAFVLSLDIAICLATVALAFLIRLDTIPAPVGTLWLAYLGSVVFAIPLFISFGLYRAIFRYVGWGALMSVVRALAVYGAIYSFVFTLVGVVHVPRSIGVLQPILLLLFVGASRAIARYSLGGGYQTLLKLGERRRVLIYGAGSAGRQLAAALSSSDQMQVIGFVDDNKTLQGSVLNGKVIYGSDGLALRLSYLAIDDLLLAIPSASRARRNEILEKVRGTSATIRTLPGLMDLAHGRVTVNDLRELEIEDILARNVVPPNQLLLGKNIAEKTVLVTGAGGSIGSELCRQIVALRPKALLLVEQSEFNLYSIDQELEHFQSSDGGSTKRVPLLASVQDKQRMESIFDTWQVDTVYHAAAYKHVPLVEHNPAEGMRNNVFGTLTVAELAEQHGVRDFVLISTDKAVRPTNIMGATKRLAEQILQALAAKGSKTRFSMVRFGNVLGSSGSVVPLFRKQIKAGGPITITHEDITRYFMTIPEAAQLVIQAGAMATGGEVFVLDMGDPVRIVDLARRMIELSGLTVRDESNPEGEIEIEFVGLRPGEKLYEELLIGDDPQPTGHALIMKSRDKHLGWEKLQSNLDVCRQLISDGKALELKERLSAIVQGFTPEVTHVDWIHVERRASSREPSTKAALVRD